jgi:hypothetical protein
MRRKREPGSNLARQSEMAATQDEVRVKMLLYGPLAVFCGFFAWTTPRSQKAEGWAANLFKEFYGAYPKRGERGPPKPLPDSLIEEWMTFRRKPLKIRLEKPAPLLGKLERPQWELDESGFVRGTLMTPEDFEVDWQHPFK